MLQKLKTVKKWALPTLVITSGLLSSLSASALLNSFEALHQGFDSVVLFSAPGFDVEANESFHGYCNGTLLSMQVMITAAHCVGQASILADQPLDIQPGQYVYLKKEGQPVRRIGWASKYRQQMHAKYYFIPSFQKKLDAKKLKASPGPSEDLAIVFFDKPLALPQDWPTAKLLNPIDHAAIVANLKDQNIATVSVNPASEIATNDLRRIAPITQIKKSFLGYFSADGRGRVEPGDSGSPLFVYSGKEWKILGITKGQAGNLLMDWDVYGLADHRVCQMIKKIPDGTAQAICL